jgi:hypothetical protein
MSKDIAMKFRGFLSFSFLICSFGWAETPTLRLKGFGGAGMISTDTATQISEYGGKGTKINLTELFNLGINGHAELSKVIKVQGQFSTFYDGYNYQTQLDWGFVSWSPITELSFRFGRIILPIWLHSQQIDVGYSYVWPRLPREVYNLNLLKSANGVSALWKSHLGPGFLNIELFASEGSAKFQSIVAGIKFETPLGFSSSFGGTLSYSLFDETLVVQGSVSQADLTEGLVIPGALLSSVGARFDNSKLFVSGEFAFRKLEGGVSPITFSEKAKAYYASLGYRILDFMPLFTYSKTYDLAGLSLHPVIPNVSMTGGRTLAFGLNYYPNDSMVVSAEFGSVNRKYLLVEDLSFNTYTLKADFVF